MTQTSVSTSRQRAFPGMLVDTSLLKNGESKVNSEASAEIRFGIMVKVDGSDNEKVKLVAAITGETLAGVVVHNHAYAKDDELGTTGIKPKVSLTTLTRGRAWVIVEADVTIDDPVHLRCIANGGNTTLGAFAIAQDGVNTKDVSGFCRWLGSSVTYTPSGGSAIKVAPLEFDLAAE
jgi:hypothetical protein